MKTRFVLAFVLILSSAVAPLSTSDRAYGADTQRGANAQALQTSSSDLSGDWLTNVQADIQKSEYAITWQDHTYLADVPTAYQAPNRAHNFRTYFTESGIRLIPRQ